jgi:hypothetical protein
MEREGHLCKKTDCYPAPTAQELLSDPLVRAVMVADAVDEDELRALLDRLCEQQRAPETERAAARI